MPVAPVPERECRRPDSFLRARLLGRQTTAAAADGDVYRFRRSSHEATGLLRRSGGPPPFLYYLAPPQLAAERAPANRKRLLAEAIDTLSGTVGGMSQPRRRQYDEQYPRSALQSARGRTHPRAQRPALARRARNRVVADLLPDFDRALLPA